MYIIVICRLLPAGEKRQLLLFFFDFVVFSLLSRPQRLENRLVAVGGAVSGFSGALVIVVSAGKWRNAGRTIGKHKELGQQAGLVPEAFSAVSICMYTERRQFLREKQGCYCSCCP